MKIISFYNNNISPKVVEAQKSVFDYFEMQIEQILTPLQHPDAIDHWLENNEWQAVTIYDIDCIPINDIWEDMITTWASNASFGIVGAAQKASHIPNSIIYASPSFISFNKYTFAALGSPSFKPTQRGDVGAELTYKAREKGMEVRLLYPTHVEKPKWQLDGSIYFGHGTNYENTIYHAFESRMNNESTNMFIRKCQEVINGKL